MKKLFITVMIITISMLNAKEVTLSQAVLVAKNILNEGVANDFAVPITGSELQPVNIKENLVYVFNITGEKGFAIVAADDRAFPVLGYSSSGSFDADNIPPSLQWLLDSYQEQLQSIRENNLKATGEIAEKWNRYSSDNFLPETMRDEVGPLITSVWNQCAYYNTLCPVDADGCDGHVPVGCVATAMAQIMDYYQYPTQGTGSHSYYAEGYGQQTANFGATTYNWDNIPDFLTDYNIDVETLGYHCGVSVEMMYGPHGSGAYSDDVLAALQTYFGYSGSMQYLYKDYHGTEEWNNILRQEIDAARPIHYSGFGDAGGHAFICDGYEGTDHFHFNWGWDGLFNGYYYLDNLNPRNHNFSEWQGALIGIHPTEGPTADLTADHTTVLTGSSVNFTDTSTQIPTGWNWTFEGGTPATSVEQNPLEIVYSTSGNFDVTLTVTNETGNNTIVKNQYITVTDDAEPIAGFTLADTLFASNDTISVNNYSMNSPSNYEWTFVPNTVTYQNGTNANSEEPSISFDQAGTYQITLIAENGNGNDSITKTVHIGGLPLPYTEDFELTLGNTGWTVENPDNDYSWDGNYFAGGYTNGRKSTYVNCFSYNSVGERDGLISPLLNFSNTSNIDLSFKHAYAARGSHQDSLIVYISDNNGDNWNRIYAVSEDGSGNFATHQPMTTRFTPESVDDWSGSGWGADDIVISLDSWTGC
ncbi:MAG: C10 family peptidase, partial [Candidatus Cloacimonetes bacterium]|nr:C10 family peptidase [Candidatus Cloacimonadota bacterium]